MREGYSGGRKTVCFRCEKRHPHCHNCEERQKEIEKEQAEKEAMKKSSMAVTDAFEKQKKPRRNKSLMRRY